MPGSPGSGWRVVQEQSRENLLRWRSFYRSARTVVDLEQPVGHAFKRLLHVLARADGAFFPTLDGGVGLLDGREDGAGIDVEDCGFLVHVGQRDAEKGKSELVPRCYPFTAVNQCPQSMMRVPTKLSETQRSFDCHPAISDRPTSLPDDAVWDCETRSWKDPKDWLHRHERWRGVP
jgi:hypothetical protein